MSRLRVLLANVAAVVSGKAVAAVAGSDDHHGADAPPRAPGFRLLPHRLTYRAFRGVLADCGIYMVTLREMSRPGADAARVAGTAIPLRLVSSISVLLLACAVAWAFPYDRIVKWGVLIGAGCVHLPAGERLAGRGVPECVETRAQRHRGRHGRAGDTGVRLGSRRGAPRHAGDARGDAVREPGGAGRSPGGWRGVSCRSVCIGMSAAGDSFCVLGLPIAGSQILGMAILRGDSLLLSLFQPAAAVGLYGVVDEALRARDLAGLHVRRA